MKIRTHVKLLVSAILSMWLINACADQTVKYDTMSATKASPATTAAIAEAASAIKAANANDWIWRDTEKFLKQAEAAASKGDDDAAIKLANKAKFQAEAAINQYNHEKANPRGL